MRQLIVALSISMVAMGLPARVLALNNVESQLPPLQSAKQPAQPAGDTQASPVSGGKMPSLVGYVSTTTSQNEVAACIDESLSTAVQRNMMAQKREEQVSKYHKIPHVMWKTTMSIVNYTICDRGFLPSIEGGKLALDEDVKVHDKYSADFARQKLLDKLQDQAVTDVVELVTGFGMSPGPQREQILSDAMKSLTAACGDETATHIYDRLKNWAANESIQGATYDFGIVHPLSIAEKKRKVQGIVTLLSQNDPVTQSIIKRINHFGKHGKVATITSQVVESALSLASLAPTFIDPAAQAALLAFFEVTGGPEEDKLIAEMYLGKRMQSRTCSLVYQAQVSVDATELAIETRNIALLRCSKELIRRLTAKAGSEGMAQKSIDETAKDQLETKAVPVAEKTVPLATPAAIQ